MAILSPGSIVGHASAVAVQLRRDPLWTPGLGLAAVDSEPLLVTSTAPSRPDGSKLLRISDYFIVLFSRDSAATARLALDAETGELLEAEGVREQGTSFAPYVSVEDVVRKTHRSFMPGVSSAALVWRPCRESTSRFAPFWRVALGGQEIYVRVDGQIFGALTTIGRG